MVTRDGGVRSVLAKGARRSSRRFGSGLDLFAQGTAHLYAKPGRDLDTLSGFDFSRARPALGTDLGRFTGASASVKGYSLSAAFAMGKFGLRGLTQSMARELAPQNIHVAHFVIDGGIRQPGDTRGHDRGPDALLDPDAIAANYLAVHRQHRSAWTAEIELRPWVEKY